MRCCLVGVAVPWSGNDRREGWVLEGRSPSLRGTTKTTDGGVMMLAASVIYATTGWVLGVRGEGGSWGRRAQEERPLGLPAGVVGRLVTFVTWIVAPGVR